MPRYLTKKTVTQVFFYITVAPDTKEAIDYTERGANIIDKTNTQPLSIISVIKEIPTEIKYMDEAFNYVEPRR